MKGKQESSRKTKIKKQENKNKRPRATLVPPTYTDQSDGQYIQSLPSLEPVSTQGTASPSHACSSSALPPPPPKAKPSGESRSGISRISETPKRSARCLTVKRRAQRCSRVRASNTWKLPWYASLAAEDDNESLILLRSLVPRPRGRSLSRSRSSSSSCFWRMIMRFVKSKTSARAQRTSNRRTSNPCA